MKEKILKECLELLSGETEHWQKSDMVVHKALHKEHTYHHPEKECKVCELVEKIRKTLGRG